MLKIEFRKLLDLASHWGRTRLVVGYSGGLDSQVLLHWLSRHLKDSNASLGLAAIHVHHGLSSAADTWQSYCELGCQKLGIPLITCQVSVETGGSLEEKARNARYEAFAGHLLPSDMLLLAHHLDDQLETALFRLFRGNGYQGMPQMRQAGDLLIYRPLLSTGRAAIYQWAEENRLSWIEDESNADLTHDRNFIRSTVMPLLRDRWPDLDARLEQLLQRDEALRDWLADMALEDRNRLSNGEGALNLADFNRLHPTRRKNLLHYWIASVSSFPSERFLEEALRQMASASRFELRWQSARLLGKRGELRLLREVMDTKAE